MDKSEIEKRACKRLLEHYENDTMPKDMVTDFAIEISNAQIDELAQHLEWNISSIKASTASREAQIRLESLTELLKKVESLKIH